jgi:8-oxo-dGTP diphosphatase
MGTNPHREIACAILVDDIGRFLLQQRDNIPGILFPGKVGLFGGHREGSETHLQCVVREIHEETGHFIPPDQFEYLTGYLGADPEVDGGTIHAEFYVCRGVPVELLVINEGSLVAFKRDQIDALEPQLTPAARFALKAFLGSQNELRAGGDHRSSA